MSVGGLWAPTMEMWCICFAVSLYKVDAPSLLGFGSSDPWIRDLETLNGKEVTLEQQRSGRHFPPNDNSWKKVRLYG